MAFTPQCPQEFVTILLLGTTMVKINNMFPNLKRSRRVGATYVHSAEMKTFSYVLVLGK